MRGNWSAGMWFLIAVAAFLLLVLIPWLMTHPPPKHPH